MDEISKNPLQWFVDSFAVTSAFVFVVSGLINEFMFYATWRINYFLIANPSDVVMSAFVFGAMLMFAAAIAYLLTMIFAINIQKLLSWAVDRWLPQNLKGYRPLSLGGWIYFMCMYSAAILLVTIAYSAEHGTLFWYETGLNVAQTSRIGGGQCGGAHVAWLGASAAVLECRDGVHVIHKLDDLETVRRFR